MPRADRDELAVAVAAWAASLPSARTRAAYDGDLQAFLAWCERSELDWSGVGPVEVERFCRDGEGDGLSAATTNRRLAALGSVFRHLVAAGLCEGDPVATVGRRPAASARATPVLGPSECEALWRSVAGEPRVAVVVGLLLFDGLRLEDVLALDHVALRRRSGRTRVTVDGPTGAREVVLDPRTATAVGRLGRGPGQVVAAGEGRLDRFQVAHLLRRAGARAGLDRTVTATVLRRTCAVTARAEGASLREVGERLGLGSERAARRILG